jgi:drug/metabolite transporter (DMT)-like permease
LRPAASALAWAAAAGLTDVVGLLAFSRGGAAGQVAVTAAVSSIYPAIPLVAGLVMFGERLSRRQLAGVGCIVAGLVLIGLA